MPPISRITDIGLGHSCFPPTKAIASSGNVTAGGLKIFRQGDALAPHKCGKSAHGRKAASGSGSVFVNGKAAMRIGDSIDCGGAMGQGCGTVVAGG